MKRSTHHFWILGVLALAYLFSPAMAPACILCPNQGNPLAREIAEAKLVVFGSIASARLDADGIKGTSQFTVNALIKGDATLIKGGAITLPRYVPPVPGVQYLVFLDTTNGQIDPYRNIVCNSNRIVDYLKKMPPVTAASTPAQRQARLKYLFDFLNDRELEIAADAFKEWAVSSNQDVSEVAAQLDVTKLRAWLLDPKTPAHCLGLYAFLLGACGTPQDALLLKGLITNQANQRMAGALDGLLAGYLRLDAKEGWLLVHSIISSPQRTFSDRHAVLRFLRFTRDAAGEKAQEDILKCIDLMLQQPDVVDLTIEALRRWQSWERTGTVLPLFNDPRLQAAITKRAIVRYGLSCPLPEAKSFIDDLRKKDAELVKDVEEAMVFEK